MTFVILSDDRAIIETDDAADAMRHLATQRQFDPECRLAEVLIAAANPRTAIPGELDRAIDAWNAMTDRINVHIDKVQSRAQYVVPYRKWVKAAGRRDYFLEQLIADVEAQPYIWPTIRFGWLLRSARMKDGELNSEKIRARAFGKSGNGQITEAAYLALARTVAIWERESGNLYCGGEGSHAEAFERAIGVSVQRFEELRKRFNGGGVNAEV